MRSSRLAGTFAADAERTLTAAGAALVGAPGAPSLTPLMVVAVLGVALIVALASTLTPAIRAARSSTVSALADSARPPRRHGALISLSARLPGPALFGLRLAARRPRRALLSAASIAVTVAGIVTVLAFHATVHVKTTGMSTGGLIDPPSVLWVAAAVLGTLLVVAGLTAFPAMMGARIPAPQILQSETA